MSETWRISGRKVALPAPSPDWKISPRPGGWWVAESPSGERRRFALLNSAGRLSACVEGCLWSGPLVGASETENEESADDSNLVAQFPGKVRKILVSNGARVKEGDPLVLVEAMKMEFAVKSPFDGVVAKILVTEGQQISPGDRFLDLETKSDS